MQLGVKFFLGVCFLFVEEMCQIIHASAMDQFAYTTYDDTVIHYRMESFFPFKRSYVNVSFILIKTQATVLFTVDLK